MKLSKEVLIEIVDLVRKGLVTNTDISDHLRQLDLVPADQEEVVDGTPIVVLGLSPEYLEKNPRTDPSVWIKPQEG